MTWLFDHYRVGKRRLCLGAPIPVAVRFREVRSKFGTISDDSFIPKLVVRSEIRAGERVEYKHAGFELSRTAPGNWEAQLNTSNLGVGSHEFLFSIDDKYTIHASDAPIFILAPENYRAELMEEAKEPFVPSRRIEKLDELLDFARFSLEQKIPDYAFEVRPFSLIVPSTRELPTAITSSSIAWTLDGLITEFLYLTTLESNIKRQEWYISFVRGKIGLGFRVDFIKPISKEMQASVSNREVGDLYLLGLAPEFAEYEVITEFPQGGHSADIGLAYRMNSPEMNDPRYRNYR